MGPDGQPPLPPARRWAPSPGRCGSEARGTRTGIETARLPDHGPLGAVGLAEGPSRLVVGEGIESTLSLLCGLLDAPASAWAALSTSGLRGLRLPPEPGRLTIAQDGDTAGREAAHELARRADANGWRVGILDPGDGADFNDILTGKAVAA